MACVKRKRIKGRDDYCLAQCYRPAGKVRTRTLKYLGTRPHVPAEYRYPSPFPSPGPLVHPPTGNLVHFRPAIDREAEA
jgi:hypothetical protein